MKRPLPDNQKSVKRRKITAHSELPKPKLVRKEVKLKGRARLRLQNKEQSICIEQKNKQIRQLERDIERLKAERHNSNNLLGFVDRFWAQLTSDLELILADLGASRNFFANGEEGSFLTIITKDIEIPSTESETGDNDIENAVTKEAEKRTTKTKKMVLQIVNFSKQLEESRKRLWDLIKAEDSPKIEVSKLIQAELTQLRAQVDRIRAEASKKHAQCADLRTRCKNQEEQLTTIQQHVVWLEEQNSLIATAYKRLIRTSLYQSKNSQQLQAITPSSPSEADEETKEQNKQVFETEVQNLLKRTEEDKIAIVRLQNEKIELLSRVDAGLKQYNGKDLEIRVLKSDQALQEDAFHQTKASHESAMSILSSSHKTQVEELERRIEEYAKEITALKVMKSKLRHEVEKINMKEMKGLIEQLEKRDVEQQAVLVNLRDENQQMREQIGNKDLRMKLKQCEADIFLKDSEIKNLKAMINSPDVFERSMYKTEINRLKHRSRRLEGEIAELKKNTQAKKLHNLEKKMDILGAEVDRSAKEYQELQKEKETKVQSLLKQIQALTETNSRLKHLNASHNHTVKRLNDEKFALQQNMDAQRVVAAKQQSYIASKHEQLSMLATRNSALQNTANTSQHAAQKLRNHLISLTQKYYHMQAEEELQQGNNQKLKERLENKEALISQLQSDNRQSQDRYQRTKASLKRAKTLVKNGGGDPILQKQLEISRKRLLCTLCGIKRKEVIITKCMHMFCESCIHKHFASRNRKCPQCKHSFGKADIKDVSFNFTI